MNYPYRTREVRDLAWACFSPPLLISPTLATDVHNCALTLTEDREQWLRQLDEKPVPLLEHLAQARGTRLGLYFESLWHFFLEQDSQVDLIAHNLPVYEGGQTIGEFDCLYFCHQRQRHVHLELAVKYYLGLHSFGNSAAHSAWNHWVGPAIRDRLDIKLSRLLDHQIQLGRQSAGKQSLQNLGIREPLKEIEIKGYLFAPAHESMPPPKGFNANQRLYPWIASAYLLTFLAGRGAQGFTALPRSYWLSPIDHRDPLEALSAARLLETYTTERTMLERPQLIAAIDQAGFETDRFFLCSSDWPELIT